MVDKQMSIDSIPGFLKSPDWADWVEFCPKKGWLFMEKMPEDSSSIGVITYGQKWMRACDFIGVEFIRNHKMYSGKSRPWPEDMPNN